MWLRAFAIGLACATSAGILACGSAPMQGSAWLQVRTTHFDLHTDLIEPAALDMAHALEESRAALLSVAWQGAPDPRGRTEVTVFASEDRYREYWQRNSAVGLAQSLAGAERLIVAFWEEERPHGLPLVAVHEIAHDLSDWFTPLQPAWYSEGMAQFLEGVEYDRAKRRAVLGGVPAPMVRVLQSYDRSAAGVEGLFTARDPHKGDDRATSRFYFTSWLLVHWLINRHGDPFRQFQSDLSRLVDWREAWSSRFPSLGPRELDARLEEYMDGGRFDYISEEVEVPPFSPRLRVLSAAEGHGLSSWMASRLGASELAMQDMERALALDPNELNALRTRYRNLRGPSHAAARLSVARKLVRAHSQSAEAWLLLARSADSATERSSAIDQAQSLAPDHPGVLELLASRSLDARDNPAALVHSQILIRRTAPSIRIIILHLQALARNGRCDEARHFAHSVRADSPKCSVRHEGKPMLCLPFFEKLVTDNCNTPSGAGAKPT